MQVTETLSDGLKRAFTVVVPASDIESKRVAKLTELGRTMKLPGFRPGKVPLSVVRQRYGNAVMAEVLQESVDDATQKVLSERGLRPAGQPKVELADKPEVTGEPAADLEFKMELELLPEVPLPDLSQITLTRLKAEPGDEVIDRALASIAERNRTIDPVTEDRGAQQGDILTVDFIGKVDGVPFPGGTAENVEVEVGGTGFIPGFAEQLVGMRPADSRTITVTFPEAYHATELAGKTAQFEITAKALGTPAPAPLDDALAGKVGLETLDKLRDAVRQQFQREYDQVSRTRLKRELLDALAEVANFPAPENLVEAEFTGIWQRVEADRKQGSPDAEDQGKDEATLRREYREIAERRVRLGLLLAEIGRVNGITVSAEEINRAIRNEASRYPGQEQQVVGFFRSNPRALDSIRGPLYEDKVVDYILELARVEDRQVPAEELTAMPEAADAASPT